MSEAREADDPNWLAGQSFESLANLVRLDDMPDNGHMAKRGINEGIWMRTCAVILQDDDKQLYA